MIRVILFAIRYKRLKWECPWMFDGARAAASVNACIAEDGQAF